MDVLDLMKKRRSIRKYQDKQIAREDFDNETGRTLLKEWGIPDTDTACCFVILGYCDGDYPKVKPRKENRFLIID